MLKQFVENKHCKFVKSAKDWKDAIRMSCEVLEADGTVEENYKEDIIACVEKYGPYIVIMPNVALPHSQEGAKGVHKTAISFLKLEEPVSFEEGNEDMNAQLFFTLASCDSEQHLANMSKLSELLSNEDVMKELETAKNEEDLLEIYKKYFN